MTLCTDVSFGQSVVPDTTRSSLIIEAPCASSDSTCIRLELHPQFVTGTPDSTSPDSTIPGSSSLDSVRIDSTQRAEQTQKSTLKATGSLSRSILTGSSQQATLDGELQIRIEGPIGENGELRAELNDRNIPIMPDGATQSLAELDRLRIEYSSLLGSAALGDVSIDYMETRFTPIKRMLQGASLQIDPVKDAASHRTILSLAAQRGEIHELLIQPKEGIRGPYPLQGKYNESSIIILPGTERVWLNGERLQQGVGQGYLLDAAFAEITYTGGEVLSSTDVLRVEFQYITQNYTRTLLQAQSTAKDLVSGRLSVTASYLRESDANESERSEAFELLGDPSSSVGISGADSVGRLEDATFPLYAKVDTIVGSVKRTIYEYRPGDPSAVFRVRFSNLGEGAGSYKRLLDETNGVIYRWVGLGNGAYEPVIQAQPPVSRQLFTLASRAELNRSWSLSGEWAVSDVDENRFSSFDDQDNMDHGLWIVLQGDSLTVAKGVAQVGLEARFTGKRFETLDPIRDPMYVWRLGLTELGKGARNLPASLQPMTAEISPWIQSTRALGVEEQSLQQTASWKLPSHNIETSMMNQWINLGGFQGWAHQSDISTRKSFAQIQHISWTNSGYRTSIHTDGEYPLLGQWFIGWEGGYRSQTLQESLQRFDIKPQIGFEQTKIKASVFGRFRVFKRPDMLNPSQWVEQEKIQGVGGAIDWHVTPSIHTQQSMEWRINQEEARQVSFFQQTRYGLTSNSPQGNVLIQLDAEQRPLQSFSYVYVGPQFGTHVWDDVNQDGIEQYDEFFPSLVPGEGEYLLRQLITTNFEPLSTLRAEWQHQYSNSESPWRWFSTIRLLEESRIDNPMSLLSFDPTNFLNHQTTRSGRFSVDESIEWIRLSKGITSQFQRVTIHGLHTQSLRDAGRGIESNTLTSVRFSTEWGAESKPTWTPSIAWESSKVESGAFSNRAYDLTRTHFKLSWSERRSRALTLQASIGSQLTQEHSSESILGTRPQSQRHRAEFSVRSFTASRLQTSATVHGQWITSTQSTNPFVNFELTQGVGDGWSGGWSLDIQGEVGEFELGLRSVAIWVGNDPFGRDKGASLRQTVQATARWIL